MTIGNTKFYDLNRQMQLDMRAFTHDMVDKLHKNRHKDGITSKDVPTLMKLLMTELGEFMEQYMNDKRDNNTLIELADAANFLFLISQTVRKEVDDIPF